MANYNHEILVNYLRDVYSMELLVRKIEDDVHSTGEDVEYLQTLIEKADSTPVPQKGTVSYSLIQTPFPFSGVLQQHCACFFL